MRYVEPANRQPAVMPKFSMVVLLAWACSGSTGVSPTALGGGNGLGGRSSGPIAGGAEASGGNQPVAGDHSSGGSEPAASSNGGGSLATGGSDGTGGVASTGGARSSGGKSALGGGTGSASGGTKASGAGGTTGGSGPSGGNKASGGTYSTGGRTATGGTSLNGGTAANGGKPGTSTGPSKCSVFIAGDSTVSTYSLTSSPKDQAGWGQMLQRYFDSNVTVVNKAVGGMTARHFIQAGNLDAILAALKAGDYFLVQFGTNDSNSSASYTIDGVSYPYFADANTDFKTYLQEYIDGANAKGATPVLVTPPPRNSAYCNGGRSMGSYAQAMLDLGAAQRVAVVDLSMKTWTYLSEICPKPADGTSETFFKVNSDNSIDGTHFQENGAIMLAGFVADGIGEAGLGLGAYRVK